MILRSLPRFAIGPVTARTCRTALWLAVGLAVHATAIVMTVPALAQGRPALTLENLALGTVLTATIRGAANVAVGDLWIPEYEIQADPHHVMTYMQVVGQVSRGLELLGVRANRGTVEVDPVNYTVTDFTASTTEPLLVVPTVRARAPGQHTQRVEVIFPGFAPSPYTDTLLAQEPPLQVQLHREYPGITQLRLPITETWQATGGTVLTETRFTGQVRNGVYEQVVTDQGRCAVGATAFRCALGAIGPGLPAAHLSVTAMALEAGQVDQVFRVRTPGQIVSVRTQTVVQDSPAFLVSLATPDSRNAAISPAAGTFALAVLSSTYLDAPGQVDRESLAFGPSGTERSALFCDAADVNRDRRADLVCRFDAAIAGFRPGDTVGVLTGQTFSGVPIRGTGTLLVAP